MKNYLVLLVALLGSSWMLAGCTDQQSAGPGDKEPPPSKADDTGDSDVPDKDVSDKDVSDKDVSDKDVSDKDVSDKGTSEGKQDITEPADIVVTAAASEDFTTLVAAIRAAGLVDTLKGEGPFTVFAPTDAAFDKLPEGTLDELLKPENKDKLTDILTYHVVPGEVTASEVLELDEAATVQGAKVSIGVDNDQITVGDANVIASDLKCSNGLIHVIDAVLMPPEPKTEPKEEPQDEAKTEPKKEAMDEPQDIVATAVAAGNFETLVAAVQAAGLVDTLKGQGPFTVFAPTDAAFGKLPEGTVDELLKPENKQKLTDILTYHVVPGKVLAADVVNVDTAKTVQGGELEIKVVDDKVQVGGATVTATDIQCSNGVIHVVDSVILPPEPKAEPKDEPKTEPKEGGEKES